MSDIGQLGADFESHHIEGYAHQAREGNGYFKAPLISHVEGNLWQGGCIGGVELPADFKYVLSLYPWEQYRLGPDTERVEVRLYDSGTVPDRDQLYELAAQVKGWCAKGKTLVHCQAGLNRSGLIAALSLVLAGSQPAEAIALLRSSRSPVVLCNQAFENWLLDQEPPIREQAAA